MTHARRGRGWEAQLDNWHRQYRRDALAWVVKTNPPTKMVGGKMVYEAKGPPDYVGVIEGGRSVVFDAKETSMARWPFSSLKLHQAQDLEAAHDRGALAFLALRYSGGTAVRLWWCDIREQWWNWRASGGRPASLSLADALDLGTPMDPHLGWLTGIAHDVR